MIRWLAIYLLLSSVTLIQASSYSDQLRSLYQDVTVSLNGPVRIEKTKSQYDEAVFEKLFFYGPEHTYRLIIKDQKEVSFSSQKQDQVAFEIIFEANLDTTIGGRVAQRINQDLKTYAAKHGRGPSAQNTSLFEQDGPRHEQEIISTSDVLSWNRMLKNAYQGSLALSSSTGASASGSNQDSRSASAGSSSGNNDSGSVAAMNLAKSMNTCGGNNKSHHAHQKSLQNIAEALVMAQQANAMDGSSLSPSSQSQIEDPQYEVEKASQAYTDASRDYQKQSKEDIAQTLQALNKIDIASRYKFVQSEKRILEKSIQRNEIDYIFSNSPKDQASFEKLQGLIKNHTRLKTLRAFQQMGRKLIMSKDHLDQFAASPGKLFIFDQGLGKWMISPIIQSKEDARFVLIEILSQNMASKNDSKMQ